MNNSETICRALQLAGIDDDEIDITTGNKLVIIRPRTNSTIKKAWQSLISNEQLKRGIEIAHAGGHTVGVIYNPACDKDALDLVMPSARTAMPCPCGWLSDQRQPCTCTDSQITGHRQHGAYQAVMACDLILQMQRPRESDRGYIGRQEEYTELERRIKEMYTGQMQHGLPEEAAKLLKMAMERLDISKRHDITITVAETIARLDQSDKILAHHIAEAVSYQRFAP